MLKRLGFGLTRLDDRQEDLILRRGNIQAYRAPAETAATKLIKPVSQLSLPQWGHFTLTRFHAALAQNALLHDEHLWTSVYSLVRDEEPVSDMMFPLALACRCRLAAC